jgi:integrase
MARATNKLTDAAVKRKKWEPGCYADGLGLYLQVAEGGSKSWLFRFMRNGHARKMGLGPVHTVSLVEAREEALKCRKMLREGIDPIEARKSQRIAVQLGAARSITFRQCAEQYIADHEQSWKNQKHRDQWPASLKNYAYPAFGNFPVSEIDLPLVLKAIKPIWHEKPETASRVRGRIETILGWATTHGYRQGDNPARWRGHLKNLLPPTKKVRRVEHHAALPYGELPAFMGQLRDMEGVSAKALEFAILTATRTSETLKARWSEINLKAGMWTIPAERMKAEREHRVPLSKRAIELLEKLPREKKNEFVFIGTQAGTSLSDMSLLMTLRRMDRGDLTTHGFRSTFRDWAAERTAYPNHVVEQALAHSIGSKVEAAYRRGDLLKKRERLMADWAKYCSQSKPTSEVVPIRAAQ